MCSSVSRALQPTRRPCSTTNLSASPAGFARTVAFRRLLLRGTMALGAVGSEQRGPDVRRIDSHLHTWAPVEQKDTYPFAGAMLGASGSDPPMPGHAEALLADMDAAGVAGALIVQPTNHLYDHSYVISVLRRYPQRFVGCMLADPTPGGGGAAAVQQLAQEHGFRAVRFNPYLWPEGERMTNEVGRAMYAKAGELGLPVGHMPFKGFLLHADEIEQLATQHPETPVLLDHFGFNSAADLGSPEWLRLLALAKLPQVYIKASGFFRVSAVEYPHGDAAGAALRLLVDTFGPQRVMWGSDWPWVTTACGYVKAWSLLDDFEAASGTQVLTEEERKWVFGGTIASLFPGAWPEQQAPEGAAA